MKDNFSVNAMIVQIWLKVPCTVDKIIFFFFLPWYIKQIDFISNF